MSAPEDVTVSIFGTRYTLRSDAGSQTLEELAAQVDARMREAAGHAGPASADRLAVLVALNLADDLARERRHASATVAGATGVADRLERLIAILADEVGTEGAQGV